MDSDEISLIMFRRVINLIKAKLLEGLETDTKGNQMDERLDQVNAQLIRLRLLLLRILKGESAKTQQEQEIVTLFQKNGGLGQAMKSRDVNEQMRYYLDVDVCDYPYTLNTALSNAFLKREIPGQDLCEAKE